jgi:tRNA (cytidine/uridine-2'-O-)-methyltransferase
VARFFNIVLIEPEIPQNTGNIGRTCVSIASELHLVGSLGFEISDKNLKRAGLDYWPHLKWQQHLSFKSYVENHVQNHRHSHAQNDTSRMFLFSAFGKKPYTEISFQRGDHLVFGKETKGIDPQILEQYSDQVYQIPMYGPVRGLNLATAVAIVGYEGVRQLESLDS